MSVEHLSGHFWVYIVTVQSCSSSHLKLSVTKLLKSCQHSFERATHFWCETECQRLDKAVSTFGRSVHIPRQRGLTAEATARDRKTTKTVAVSALFKLLLLLRSRATCSASFLFSKLPRRLETGPVDSNPTWTQAWKFQGEKISRCWKDCWPCWWP